MTTRRVPSLLVVGVLLLAAAPLAPTSAATCDGAWRVQTGPSKGQTLNGVDASAVDQAWAVGSIPGIGASRTWAQRWNGTDWSAVAVPYQGSEDNALNDVTVLAPDDAWAVGWWHDPGDGSTPARDRALIEHWNGRAWSIVRAPRVAGNHRLAAVDAVSPDDVWAVGGRGGTILIEHWNGRDWSVVPVEDPGPSFDRLFGVAARDAGDAWAVGTTNGGRETLTMRWDGVAWTRVSSSDSDTNTNHLFDVANMANGMSMAVGSASAIDTPLHTVSERWEGTSWNVQWTPNPGTQRNSFQGIARIPATGGAWAVGYSEYLNGTSRPLIARKSAGWKLAVAPAVASPAALADVTAVEGTAWAVGTSAGAPLILTECSSA